MSPGWIRLYRSLLEHPMWTSDRFTKGQAWVDLVLSAAFEDHEVFIVHGPAWVKRGHVLTTQVTLAKRWKWNRETVRLFLRELERHFMAAIETSNASATGYTLITILNYEKFQGDPDNASATGSATRTATQSATDRPVTGHIIRREIRERRTSSTGRSRKPSPSEPQTASCIGPAAPWPSPAALAAVWNELAPAECPRVRQITRGRTQAADTALAQHPDPDYWRSTIGEIRRSAFLRGLKPNNGHKNWKANFDWLLKAKDNTENYVRVAEGVYRDSSAVEDEE